MRHNAILSRPSLSRMLSRGRARAGSLAGTIVDDVAAEIVDKLKHDVAPLVERAMDRKRPRRHGRTLVLVLLGAAACTGLCYLLWRHRDEEPAYLVQEPDRSNVAPAGSPAPASPAAGPLGGHVPWSGGEVSSGAA